MLNGALVIDMPKTSTVVFMKERTSLVVEDRNALIKKKQRTEKHGRKSDVLENSKSAYGQSSIKWTS